MKDINGRVLAGLNVCRVSQSEENVMLNLLQNFTDLLLLLQRCLLIIYVC